jgi:hypothetical protein
MADETLDQALMDALRMQIEREKELSERLTEYVGRWVAVRDQEIVAAADTYEELLAIIGADDGAEFFEVQAEGAACFF